MSQLSLLRGLSSLSRAVCPAGIDKVFLILRGVKLKLLKRIIFILKNEKLIFGTHWSNSISGNAPWEGRWLIVGGL